MKKPSVRNTTIHWFQFIPGMLIGLALSCLVFTRNAEAQSCAGFYKDLKDAQVNRN